MARRDATALYGFVAWIAVHVCFTIFLLWAYTPDRLLVSLGVTYFPDKHWALALPCWTLVSLLTAVVLYATYNAMRRPGLESLSNIVDEYTRIPDERDLGGARPSPRAVAARPALTARALFIPRGSVGRRGAAPQRRRPADNRREPLGPREQQRQRRARLSRGGARRKARRARRARTA